MNANKIHLYSYFSAFYSMPILLSCSSIFQSSSIIKDIGPSLNTNDYIKINIIAILYFPHFQQTDGHSENLMWDTMSQIPIFW